MVLTLGVESGGPFLVKRQIKIADAALGMVVILPDAVRPVALIIEGVVPQNALEFVARMDIEEKQPARIQIELDQLKAAEKLAAPYSSNSVISWHRYRIRPSWFLALASFSISSERSTPIMS